LFEITSVSDMPCKYIKTMNIKIIIVATAVMSLMFTACGHGNDGHNHEGHEHKHAHEEGESKEHEDDVIVMSPEDASFLGVKTSTISMGEFGDVLHVSGQIEAAPTDVYTAVSRSSGIINLARSLTSGANVSAGTVIATVNARNIAGGDANESAYIAMQAAKRELDRLTPLHADGIVSTREYNAAEAEFRRASAAYTGTESGSSVVSKISGVVTSVSVTDGDFVEAGTPIATIAKGERLTVRADIPARSIDALNDKIGGNIRFIGSDSVFSLERLNARRLSDKVANMYGAFVPVYFEIDNRGVNLVAGMVVDIYLTGNPRDGIIAVPVEAISEQQGVYFVYQKLDEDCYRKIPVTIGRNDGRMVEIKRGIEPGSEIVTSGTTFIKLAESNGVVPEGHTHNH